VWLVACLGGGGVEVEKKVRLGGFHQDKEREQPAPGWEAARLFRGREASSATGKGLARFLIQDDGRVPHSIWIGCVRAAQEPAIETNSFRVINNFEDLMAGLGWAGLS
jgi:hypothetical protein